MHPTHLLAASLVVLGLVACSSSTTGSGTGTGTGTGTGNPLLGGGTGTSGGATGGGTGFGGLTGTNGGNATCDDACAHYLQCKGDGWDTTQNRSTCDQNCAGLGVTPEQLTSYVGLDCQTAIVTIEGNGSSSGGTSGAGTSGGATDCNGCTWDGSSCIYLTGSGGNYFACANACCGH
jgi:hypothetical protein